MKNMGPGGLLNNDYAIITIITVHYHYRNDILMTLMSLLVTPGVDGP